MREIMKGMIILLIISFLFALIHSCSVDNGVLKPSCLVFEVDLDEKWWYPQDDPTEPAIYLRANGLLKIEGQTDDLSFVMENCNKIRVTNNTQGGNELWIIKSLTDKNLSIQYPSKGLVAYSRTK